MCRQQLCSVGRDWSCRSRICSCTCSPTFGPRGNESTWPEEKALKRTGIWGWRSRDGSQGRGSGCRSQRGLLWDSASRGECPARRDHRGPFRGIPGALSGSWGRVVSCQCRLSPRAPSQTQGERVTGHGALTPCCEGGRRPPGAFPLQVLPLARDTGPRPPLSPIPEPVSSVLGTHLYYKAPGSQPTVWPLLP